jgi:hypothetical protein
MLFIIPLWGTNLLRQSKEKKKITKPNNKILKPIKNQRRKRVAIPAFSRQYPKENNIM